MLDPEKKTRPNMHGFISPKVKASETRTNADTNLPKKEIREHKIRINICIYSVIHHTLIVRSINTLYGQKIAEA